MKKRRMINMITLAIITLVLALLLVVIIGGSALILDPLIAILAIYLIYKLVRKLFGKKENNN